MQLGDSAENAELGAFYAGLLRQFDGPTPQTTIPEIMRPLFDETFVGRFFPRTVTEPAMWLGGSNGRRVCLFEGMKTSDQSLRIAAAYNAGTGPTETNGNNFWYRNAAAVAFTRLQNLGLVTPEYVDIVGYSAGGAVGTWLLLLLQNTRPDLKTKLITFGSPRALGSQQLATLTRTNICRWMNDTDPIPLIPPRFLDSPLLMLATGLRVQLTFEDYCHTAGGVYLRENGASFPAILPPNATFNPIGSAAAWWLDIETNQTRAHAVSQYQARLLLLTNILGEIAKQNVETFPVEQPGSAPRPHLTQQQERTQSQIATRAAEQNATAVEVDPQIIFHAVRRGRTWCVEFGGQLFAFAGNKKRARHLARVGNDFARSLPKQAVVDPQTLLEQFQNFLEAGVQPGGPVNPPINVSL